jgi:hypothetical protein
MGAIPGEARVNWVEFRHAEGHLITEVPRRIESDPLRSRGVARFCGAVPAAPSSF